MTVISQLLSGRRGRRLDGLKALSDAFKKCESLTQANLQGNMIPEATKNFILLDHAGSAAQKIMGKVGYSFVSIIQN